MLTDGQMLEFILKWLENAENSKTAEYFVDVNDLSFNGVDGSTLLWMLGEHLNDDNYT